MRTLLASSGSTLGHGPMTRTHAFRRPPQTGAGPPSTRAHTQYTLFDECIAPGPIQRLRSPSPVSHRLASTSLAVSEPNPSNPTPPHPTFPFPPSQLAQAVQYAPRVVASSRHGLCLSHGLCHGLCDGGFGLGGGGCSGGNWAPSISVQHSEQLHPRVLRVRSQVNFP